MAHWHVSAFHQAAPKPVRPLSAPTLPFYWIRLDDWNGAVSSPSGFGGRLYKADIQGTVVDVEREGIVLPMKTSNERAV